MEKELVVVKEKLQVELLKSLTNLQVQCGINLLKELLMLRKEKEEIMLYLHKG